MGHCFGSEEMMPSTPRPLFRGRTPSCGKINLVLWPAARRTCRSFTTDVTRRFGLQTTKAGAPRWERQCRVLSEIPRSCPEIFLRPGCPHMAVLPARPPWLQTCLVCPSTQRRGRLSPATRFRQPVSRASQKRHSHRTYSRLRTRSERQCRVLSEIPRSCPEIFLRPGCPHMAVLPARPPWLQTCLVCPSTQRRGRLSPATRFRQPVSRASQKRHSHRTYSRLRT